MKRAYIALVVLVAGCDTVPATTVTEPSPSGYRQKSEAAIKAQLKDPFSVKEMKFTPPYIEKNSGVGYNGKWQVCSTFYAKNSFGAYTPTIASVTFSNGSVLDVMMGTPKSFPQECAGAS